MTSLDLIILGGTLILSSYSSRVASAQCISVPDRGTLTRTYTGAYVNDAYGFSVQIPRDFVGRDVDNPLYQRGFTILFDDSDEFLSVDADVNSMEWKTIGDAAKGYASFIMENDKKVSRTQSGTTVLGGRRAAIVESQFVCKGTRYASVFVITLSRDRRFVFTLRWDGILEHEDTGRQLLKSICSSWRFRKPKS